MVEKMIKLFTDIDLDGLGCGVVAKLAFGERVDVSYCSYRNLNQRVEAFIENQEHQNEEIYITDLAVSESVEHKLDKRFHEGQPIHVIDHHVTALHFNNYQWGHVKIEYDTGKKACATSLFYDYLTGKQLLKPTRSLEQFVDLVRQYDTWEWDENNNITAKRLNDLFYIMDRENFEESIIKRILETPESFSLTATETMILDIEDNKIERYIHSKNRQIYQTFIDEYCCGIVHAEQHLSELGNALNKLNPHLDMIVLMNVGGKKMGFRTIHESVDVAEFAKRYGGGGHHKASGCELGSSTFEKFVVNAFDIPPLKPDPEKNELNIKDGKSGTVYQNRKKEFSYIVPDQNGTYQVIHNREKLGQIYESFAGAERFIKRNFLSWLSFDDECLKLIAAAESKTTEAIKANYQDALSEYLGKIK
jgi:oligoribonuclease NrnB/cAMP/cGMP phosphodiesterase (DHH superfamily)